MNYRMNSDAQVLGYYMVNYLRHVAPKQRIFWFKVRNFVRYKQGMFFDTFTYRGSLFLIGKKTFYRDCLDDCLLEVYVDLSEIAIEDEEHRKKYVEKARQKKVIAGHGGIALSCRYLYRHYIDYNVEYLYLVYSENIDRHAESKGETFEEYLANIKYIN